MKASIIIPTYNRASQLYRTLQSLMNLKADYNQYEIIVVDNGSNDNTKQIVYNYKKDFPHINLRYFFDNIPGLLTGRHRGAKESGGDILVFIDDDIHVDKNWLVSIISTFTKFPDVHLVGGKCLPLYETTPPDWINNFWHTLQNGDKMLCELSLCDFGDVEKEIDATYVWGLNYSIRKKTFIELGGFNPDCIPSKYQCYQGDGETGLSFKINKKGYKTIYQPKALVQHEVPSSRMTLDYFDKRFFYQGVCNSYTEVRQNNGIIKSRFVKDIKKTIHTFYKSLLNRPNEITNLETFEGGVLMERFKSMERAGYLFHQNIARKIPGILEWILKKDYFDYNLPDQL